MTTPTYPGVYIEEVPSDVKTIVGVATARTAFVGRALRGPLDEPVRVYSVGDFERAFGALWPASTLGYAVRHYFQNGGGEAVVVRVSNPNPFTNPDNSVVPGHATASAPLGQASTIRFTAAAAGARGNTTTFTVAPSSAAGQGADPARFDLTVTGTKSDGTRETKPFADQTLATLQAALADNQSYATVGGDAATLAANLLQHGTYTLAGGADAVAARLELRSGAAIVAILEAAAPGVAGNNLLATVGPASGGAAGEFDLTLAGATTETYTDLDLAGLAAAVNAGALAKVAADSPAPTPARPANGGPTPFAGGRAAVAATADAVSHTNPPGVLRLEAASPGAWGDRLLATVTYKGQDDDPDGFNLLLEETNARGDIVAVEAHLNVSVGTAAKRRVDKVLLEQSRLARLQGTLPGRRPPERTRVRFTGGQDGPAITDADLVGNEAAKTGLYALEKEDLFNILCIPPPQRGGDVQLATWQAAMAYCEKRRAMLLVDPPVGLGDAAAARASLEGGDLSKLRHPNVVHNFPLLEMPDPLQENRPDTFVPSGAVAGLYARTDAARGVWKAPAGQEASLRGVAKLAVKLTDNEHGALNPLGLNCARTFPVTGTVMWGARTSRGADQLASEWKYVPVRRTALYIEESLFRGTQWVVFEPNDEDLWAQIRLNVGAFMHDLFRKGAFQGKSAKDAYFVKCDIETTPQSDIDKGIVNILVGFAPLKPAEFVFIRLSQVARKGGA